MDPGAHDPDPALVFEFVDAFLRDRDAGRARGLAHYLARFPGAEEAVAREYLALADEPASEPAGTPAAGPEPAPRVGPYRLLELLGRGGQGAVWLAEDTRIARRVALKVLPPSFAALSLERRARLRREAELVSRLDHPAICAVHEAEVEGDEPYIAMRLVHGETLAARLARAREGGAPDGPLALPPRGRPELAAALRYFERAARALHAAHEAGVVHRDVKPGNLMIDPQGAPVVLDFGQAHDAQGGGEAITISGDVFGTPAYMAPEQVEGRRADRRADVWALGVTLYEALTLEVPFRRASVPATLNAIREAVPGPPSARLRALPPDLDVVVATALEKDPARRYASALELAEDLRRVREYEPIHARPAGPLRRLVAWARRHPALAASGALLLVGLSSGLAWSQYLLARERAANRTALGRHLAGRARTLLEEDPAAALAVAILGAERAPSDSTRRALFAALEVCRLRSRMRGDGAHLVHAVALEPGTQRAVCALDDGTLRVFDRERGAELLRWPAHPGGVTALALRTADGQVLSGGADGRVRRWSLADGAPRGDQQGPPGAALGLELDARGARVLAWSARGFTVHDLDGAPVADEHCTADARLAHARLAPDGEHVVLVLEPLDAPADAPRSLRHLALTRPPRALAEVGLAGEVRALELDARGARLLVAGEDGSLALFDPWPAPEPARTWSLDGAPAAARFSPDGRRAVVALEGGAPSAWLLDLVGGGRLALDGHGAAGASDAAFAPDGRTLATCGPDRTVRIWDARDGAPLAVGMALMLPLEVVYAADGERLVTRAQGNAAFVWYAGALPEQYVLGGHAGPVRWAEFAPDGARVVTASADGTARLWAAPRGDAQGARPGALLAELGAGVVPLVAARFAGAGRWVVTLDERGALRRFDAPGGAPRGAPFEHGAAVLDHDVDAVGGRVATVAASGTLRLFDADPARPPRRLAEGATRARFARGGAELVAAGRGWVRRYDPSSGAELSEHRFEPAEPGEDAVVELALRPDGRELAFVAEDAVLRFLGPAAGPAPRAPLVGTFGTRALAYAPAGGRLLAVGASGSGAYRLIDLDARSDVRHEYNHRGDLTWGAFSQDGGFGLTASRDGTVVVFESASGVPTAVFDLHDGPVLHAAFAPEPGAPRVVTASADGTARVWPADPLPAARRRLPRQLADWELAREERLARPLRLR